ncbi:beta-1,4-glucuronyltransferase 1-like isoform X1 [Palaemon carinicauda]|uniref:beta-1,4-glucuronyltransferase 1-like isoform X1 n=2 Tax=Palaemon carinicauda TaxID=392227 RepID=UPI0035B65AC2
MFYQRECRYMMVSARILMVRGSLLLNAVLVLYLCLSWLSYSPTHEVLSDSQLHLALRAKDVTYSSQPPLPGEIPLPPLPKPLGADVNVGKDVSLGGRRTLGQANEEAAGAEPDEPPREVQESIGVTEHLVAEPIATDPPDPPLDSQERKIYPDLRDCTTKPLRPFYQQRGDYWILENYIPAALSFRCDESITYTTHGDYTFLDNLEPLTSRWQGPVSVAVYTPGLDFNATVQTILYLRDCWAEGIKKYVTFHLFFDVSHTPKTIPTTEEVLRKKTDCGQEPPKWTNVTTYRQEKKLLYPVNVARNTARTAAQTYFVFPSDVELYPSTNFIQEFFKMLKHPDASNTTNPRVYVLSIFEVKENITAPETKSELQKLLAKGDAIPFHKNVCPECHNIPMSKDWISAPVKPGLSVFHIGKRNPPFHSWEPIYVGTNKEPLYDERLSWEGKSDKMTQMYILCVRDYEFHILDNAFLVHRPGIKKLHKDTERDKVVGKQSYTIKKKIVPEYKTLFGSRKKCYL